jgi:hypothetical protein
MGPRGCGWVAAGAWLAAVAAGSCGGKAVVDGPSGAGGGGGAGGSTATGICATPSPSGGQLVCVVGTTTDGCYRELCDALNSRWRATCNAAGCSCAYNGGVQICGCTGVDFNAFCGAGGPSCCPEPFP